jgi:cytochrome o ubiquinol oxidase operon protein cyoD
MADEIEAQGRAPGISAHSHATSRTYLIGLFFAVVLTLASFWVSATDLVYPRGVPVLLAVLAIA